MANWLVFQPLALDWSDDDDWVAIVLYLWAMDEPDISISTLESGRVGSYSRMGSYDLWNRWF